MKKTIKYFSILVVLYNFVACDPLDVEPVSEILADSFYSSQGGSEAAINHTYNFFRAPVAQNYLIVPGIQSDEMFPTRGGNFTRNHTFGTTAVQGNVQDTWRELYGTIQACNDVLDNVPGVIDATIDKPKIIGEAHFLRAYSYLYLVRFYGKVPLVLEPSKSANQDFQIPRSETADIYQAIIDDLLLAIDLLPLNVDNKSRASQAAARTLLAKAYLTRRDANDLEAALVQTQAVLANGQLQLVSGDDYGSLFAVGQQNTRETIFELSYRPNTAQANHAMDVETVPFPNNNPRVLPTEKIVAKFLENPEDKRISSAIGLVGETYHINKYTTNDVSDAFRGTQASNIVLLRLADVILMEAEILNELGRSNDALAALNRIRERAGITLSTTLLQDALRLEIEDERYLELAFEGHRWWDIVRTNRATTISAPRLTDANRSIWPIPEREIDLNPNLLPQNPGW